MIEIMEGLDIPVIAFVCQRSAQPPITKRRLFLVSCGNRIEIKVTSDRRIWSSSGTEHETKLCAVCKEKLEFIKNLVANGR